MDPDTSSAQCTVAQAPNFRAKTTVRVAGIDDWSWRKGRTYGTIIVDLERREVVDVLQDRTTAGTAEWLGQHPSEMVAAFDRCDRVAPVTMFRAIRQQMDELGCEPDYRISSLTKLADLLEGDRYRHDLKQVARPAIYRFAPKTCSMVQSSEAADRSRVAKRHLVAYLSPLDAAEHEGLEGGRGNRDAHRSRARAELGAPGVGPLLHCTQSRPRRRQGDK